MTKVFNKRNAKRITAVVLALISIVSTIFILPANAAAKEVTVTFDYSYDTGGNIINFCSYLFSEVRSVGSKAFDFIFNRGFVFKKLLVGLNTVFSEQP